MLCLPGFEPVMKHDHAHGVGRVGRGGGVQGGQGGAIEVGERAVARRGKVVDQVVVAADADGRRGQRRQDGELAGVVVGDGVDGGGSPHAGEPSGARTPARGQRRPNFSHRPTSRTRPDEDATPAAERFAGLPTMARHRLVYDALGTLMEGAIHALSITARTPAE